MELTLRQMVKRIGAAVGIAGLIATVSAIAAQVSGEAGRDAVWVLGTLGLMLLVAGYLVDRSLDG